LKQVLLVVILAAVLGALFRVGRELLGAGAAILAAFARLLSVLVQTLPHVFVAGVFALGGVCLSITSTTHPCGYRPGCRPANKAARRNHKMTCRMRRPAAPRRRSNFAG
jgi:hypothetical protein